MYIRNNYVVIYIYLFITYGMYISNNYVIIYIYSYILTNSMDNEVYEKFQEPLLELSTN